jgi:hypothetical protein
MKVHRCPFGEIRRHDLATSTGKDRAIPMKWKFRLRRGQMRRAGGGRWKYVGSAGALGVWPMHSKSHRAKKAGSGMRPKKQNGNRIRQTRTGPECSSNSMSDKTSVRAAIVVQIRQCRWVVMRSLSTQYSSSARQVGTLSCLEAKL